MKLTFYNNACSVLEHDGFRLLSDPWLTDGAFEGSWHLYPPLRTRADDLLDVDALFISHLHPDHFDETVLARFRRDVPIVVLDHGPNYLHRKLHHLGFTHLIPILDGQTRRVGPFDLTLYAPFEKNIFHDAAIGNMLDCAMVAEADGLSVLNANDNRPSLRTAEMLRDRHGRFTVAQLNYVAASPYPACCDNLTDTEKRAEAERLSARNLDFLTELVTILDPEVFMPFAGAYVLGGKQWRKNAWIAAPTWDQAAAYVRERRPGQATLCLNEGQTYDLAEQRIHNGPYRPIDPEARDAYVETVIADHPYPHEADIEPLGLPAIVEDLETLLPQARERLASAQARFAYHEDFNVYIALPNGHYHFNLAETGGTLEREPLSMRTPALRFRLDPALLRRILRREAHWDNAEIGCHIDFHRAPNVYTPDVHTLMAFFHV